MARRRARSNQWQWTIVETRSASSGDFIRSASGLFETYHPKYRAPRVNGIRRVLSLFPCYVFVRTKLAKFEQLYRLDDVKQVFRLGCVEVSFIDHLRSMEDHLGYVDEQKLINWRESPNLVPGEMVQGLYGMFGGQVGKFVDYDEDGYARVKFKILGGRELEAHVDAHELSVMWELHAA